MQKIRVTEDHHFLMLEDGTPFYWLGDTAWELFHRLNDHEACEYLAARAAQGFNVIQAVALAEFDGLDVPNATQRFPLLRNNNGQFDPTLPDARDEDSYWHHVDRIVSQAEQQGIYIALLPTWGDKFNIKWGKGPEIFTTENAAVYGQWIGSRYCACANIIWMLGGDRPLENETHRQIIRAMAQGIRQGGADQLMTFHPNGASSSSDYVQDESWLDINTFQSGHGRGWHKSWMMVQRDWSLSPSRPVINSEPRYEDHPAYFQVQSSYYYGAYDTRVHIWWDSLSGAAGHTYGNHCIWSMNKAVDPYFPFLWKDALWHDGARQMHIAKDVMLRFAYIRQPMQELLLDQGDAASHLAACRSGGNVLCYTPLGQPIRVKLALLDAPAVRASWIDPRTGNLSVIGIFPNEDCTFVPLSQGKDNDWVLLLEEMPNL